ncbi:diguanylate cyclase [Terrilactibacillus sp. BCM23-1]|uniref:Diguanylate cyclase n=1 Tax=Terrilactibacillus tamarindi TaxID=2599694 RepID=A0A6N8CNR4_9BACI|nr:sensor domain-containing diguanylate cyclase [Terrilactibacillus tamarindi]MTT31742.1 diguanylate cyclase [Terrilactibacillus tamarindi]
MGRRLKIGIWVTWLIAFLTIIPLIYHFEPPQFHYPVYSMVGMSILMILSSLSSFRVKGINIILLDAISFATLLMFGLLINIVIVQLGILTYILSKRMSKKEFYRIPLNSIIFLLVCLVSGLVYDAIGGETGIIKNWTTLNFGQALIYYVTSFLTNHLCIYLYRKWILKANMKFIEQDTFWEVLIVVLQFPLSIILCLMYGFIGMLSIVIISVPLVSLSVIVRLINEAYNNNRFLQQISRLGQKLSEQLSVDHIRKTYFKTIFDIFPVDFVYLVTYENPNQPKLDYVMNRSQELLFPKKFNGLEDVSYLAYKQGKSQQGKIKWNKRHFLDDYTDWKVKYYLITPVIRDQQVIGVFTGISEVPFPSFRQWKTGADIICSIYGTALENALNFEKTKQESIRCPLTNLYNYRYFMSILDDQFRNNNKEHTPFSLIMIDIDDFKAINDTYGHENGNVVLKGIAKVLESLVGKKGIVARYGGEEFIILLFDDDKKECASMAETIRHHIASEDFMIYNEEDELHVIKLTVSIGFATAPSHGEDAPTLIRNADRAMYLGAKQKGKNRVAQYIG